MMMLMLPEKKMSFLDMGLASRVPEAEPWRAVTEGEEKRKESWVTLEEFYKTYRAFYVSPWVMVLYTDPVISHLGDRLEDGRRHVTGKSSF